MWVLPKLNEVTTSTDMYNSVVYQAVVPNTLINSRVPVDGEAQEESYDEEATEADLEVQDTLLGTRIEIEDEHL